MNVPFQRIGNELGLGAGKIFHLKTRRIYRDPPMMMNVKKKLCKVKYNLFMTYF